MQNDEILRKIGNSHFLSIIQKMVIICDNTIKYFGEIGFPDENQNFSFVKWLDEVLHTYVFATLFHGGITHVISLLSVFHSSCSFQREEDRTKK